MIENKSDKKIKDLLEKEYPLKAINVDFSDINNLNLVIKTSFLNSAKQITNSKKNDKYDNWFYIAEFNPEKDGPIIGSLINMILTSVDGWLNLYSIEENRILNGKKYFERTIEYLQGYVKYKHLKGIHLISNDDFYKDYLSNKISILKDYKFDKKEGTLIFEWKNN